MTVARILRDRIAREDDLINARTNIFLVLNGLGAVAVGLGSNPGAKYLISFVGVVINVLWIVVSIQCLVIVFRLTKKLIDMGNDEDPAEKIVQSTLGKTLVLRPNAVLNVYIPLILLGGWIVGLRHMSAVHQLISSPYNPF
jgi:hypothetical protein